MHLALLVYVVCGTLLSHVKATSVEKMNEEFREIITKCAAEYPITSADAEMLTNKQVPDSAAVKCMFACAYKKFGVNKHLWSTQMFVLGWNRNYSAKGDIINCEASHMDETERFHKRCFRFFSPMDDEGKLSADGVRELSKKYFADDEAKMKISEEFTNICLSVNSEPVSDGAKGCERAGLILECSIKKAPQFDIV